MIKVLILDCDGVMFDSKEANRAFYNEFLKSLGQREMDEEELEFVHASTGPEALAYLLKKRGLDPSEVLKEGSINYDRFIPLMKPEPHLYELLKRLPSTIKRSVLTNRTTTIGAVLEHFGLREYFDLVVSAKDVERPKPHPDGLIKILQHFSANPQEALFVGDTLRDAEASSRANIPFVAYKNPSLPAQYHINDLLDILGIIQSKIS
jgi:phosphoglycolate phosphatase